MLRKLLSNQFGMTLVELMVSSALFGIIGMTMAGLYGSYLERNASVRKSAVMGEDLIEISATLDVIFSNVVEILSCSCNSGDPIPCSFYTDGTPNPDCTFGSSCGTGTIKTLLDVIVEDSNDPSRISDGDCLRNNAIIEVAGTLVPRGCKKRYSLSYSVPTKIDTSTTPPETGNPGRLLVTNVTTGQVLTTIPGIYSVRCGRVRASGNTLLSNRFHLEMKLKQRDDTQNAKVNPLDLEGWWPGDPAIGPLDRDPNFFKGYHREVSGSINFRNLETQGVYYGKTTTENL